VNSRNTGVLRVPLQEAIRGGNSDCRNRNLQKMFQLVGLGEQSGFGFPKIYKNWESQHWRAPSIEERFESNQTILALRTLSLLPEESIEYLTARFGESFERLSHSERVALSTSHIEKSISHSRLKELTKEHASDLSTILHGLVEKGFLERDGKSTATFYFLPGEHPVESKGGKEVFGLNILGLKPDVKAPNSLLKAPNSLPKPPNSLPKVSGSLPKEVIQNHIDALKEIAEPVASSARSSKEIVRAVIVELCEGRYLSLPELAELLNRETESLRNKYITPMLREGKLLQKHPSIKNHPKQCYTSAKDSAGK